MPNAALMAEVADQIRLEGRHDQRVWLMTGEPFAGDDTPVTVGELRQATGEAVPDVPVTLERPLCSATGCVAGWAVVLGADPRAKILLGPDDDGDHGYVITLPGRLGTTTTSKLAEQLLDITKDQADWLFNGCRSRDSVLWALSYLPGHPQATISELERGRWEHTE